MKSSIAALVSVLATTALACDIIPLRSQLERSWVIDTMDSASDQCLIQENCFSGSGVRTILRFDSHVHNQGFTDCTVGWTPSCPRGDDSNVADQYPFHYDTCHKHWHLTGFSRYKLTDRTTNQVVASGEKNGLCLMDVACGGNKKYTCQNQGISAGCTDVYDKGLDCQWVDVTGLDLSKTYEFTWEVNPSRFIKETNYNNNFLTVNVNLATVPRRKIRSSPAPNQCPLYSNTFRSTTPAATTTYQQQRTPQNTYTGYNNYYNPSTYRTTNNYGSSGYGNSYYGNSRYGSSSGYYYGY